MKIILQSFLDSVTFREEDFSDGGGVHMQIEGQDSDFAPRVENPAGRSPILLVCEHASPRIPPEFDTLGLSAGELERHIAWDPGALETARRMSRVLDAPLVYSTVSRLVYDCNRPPDAADAMPERSEDTPVPGNRSLSDVEKRDRVARFYRPFEARVAMALDRPEVSMLVTVHSFTPVYKGQTRAVEIGILHDVDARLADAVLQVAAGYNVQRNAPYGPADGVTHTLRRHALPRRLLNVMLEVRNDLIATSEDCAEMAETLVDWLTRARALCAVAKPEEAQG